MWLTVEMHKLHKREMARQSFPKDSSHRAKQVLNLIHTNVCGPMRTETPSQHKYFLTIIYDIRNIQLYICCTAKMKWLLSYKNM